MIKLNVSAANIAVEEKETLTEGRVGLLCQFRFSPDWDGLVKTAVFDGADSRDVILNSDTVAIPAECLAAEGYSLSVGVYGKNAAGDIVIPTVYATVGKIQHSVYPSGREPAAPTPDVVTQIQQAAANAEELARSVREDADLGKFNGGKGEKGEKGDGGNTGPAGEAGGFYTPAVTQPDENTLRVAFTPSKEDMPAVADTDITLPAGGGGGGSGEDGGYYTPAVTQTTDNTMQVSFTPSKATMPAVEGKEITLPAGPQGQQGTEGPAGADGVGIQSVEQTTTSTEDGGTNVVTVIKTDGTSSTFTVRNGRRGSVGPAGADGNPGADGSPGKDGADGKSAYAYAVEGGYTGTKAEFAAKLAAEKFANPNALTFTGAVAGNYDGSAPLSVKIPSAVTDDHINELINTALNAIGVAEEGAY